LARDGPRAVARFFGVVLYDTVFDLVPGAVMVAPILLIPLGEEKLRSQDWTKSYPAAALVCYRLVTWTLYAASLFLFLAYGNRLPG
jgi:hypothetical protein